MAAEDAASTDDARIRRLMNDWAHALRAKDIDRLMAAYTPDILVFDLAPPLQYAGTDSYRRNYEEWFASFRGQIGYDFRELTITTGGNAAFAHSLNHISGVRANGETTDVWVRATIGYRKINGNWYVAHEHFSTPFEMKPPFRALLDLKP